MSAGMSDTLKRAARLEGRDWLFLAIAIRELAHARWRHRTRAIGDIVRDLEKPGGAAGAVPAPDLARMAWAIGAAAARVPWRADCLLRVMAADRWLRRLGAAPAFSLGVKKVGEAFEAHAWLACDGVGITGGDGAEFTPLLGPAAPPDSA